VRPLDARNVFLFRPLTAMPDASNNPPLAARQRAPRERTALIVDDSVTARAALKRMISNEAGWNVVGTAADGAQGLAKIRELEPDIVVMDFEMPVMNGLEAIRELRTFSQVPVIVLSGSTPRASRKAIMLMEAGASDVISKHPGGPAAGIDALKGPLLDRLNALTRRRVAAADSAERRVRNVCSPYAGVAPLMVIGASTGGPPALEEFLDALPEEMSTPVVIAQHMPETFTAALTDRLNERGPRPTFLAQEDMALDGGCVYVAPGGQHTQVRRDRGGTLRLSVGPNPADAPYRPSVDALFSSAAKCVGSDLVAAVLTGMGDDGLLGARDVVAAGGKVVAQDAASCVVYGMPRAVVEAGLADACMPPKDLAHCLSRIALRAA